LWVLSGDGAASTGRAWAAVAIAAAGLSLAGAPGAFGCAGSRLDRVPGSADYCTTDEARVFVAVFLVGLTIGAITAFVGAVLVGRRPLAARRRGARQGTSGCGLRAAGAAPPADLGARHHA
jgi:hypothetical protein